MSSNETCRFNLMVKLVTSYSQVNITREKRYIDADAHISERKCRRTCFRKKGLKKSERKKERKGADAWSQSKDFKSKICQHLHQDYTVILKGSPIKTKFDPITRQINKPKYLHM